MVIHNLTICNACHLCTASSAPLQQPNSAPAPPWQSQSGFSGNPAAPPPPPSSSGGFGNSGFGYAGSALPPPPPPQ